MMVKMEYASPVGLLTLASDGEAVTGLWLAGQKYFAAGIPTNLPACDDLPVLVRARDWLDRYFAGQRTVANELPLAPQGSAFRQSVWRILCEIPYGQTVTYGEIAKRLGVRSAQAVGGAVGHNPISIIIPCHRVLGADGSLTGYAGGLAAKQWLLRHEGAWGRDAAAECVGQAD